MLYDDKMEWWSGEGGRYNAQSECKGSVDLSTVHAVEHVSYDAFTKAHMFQIVHTSVLYIQCNTKTECAQWVDALRQLIRTNTFLHPKYHPGFFEEKDKVWSCCGIPNREFKGCLGAFDYTQLPDKTLDAPVNSAVAAKTASSSAAKPEVVVAGPVKRASAAKLLAVAPDVELPAQDSKARNAPTVGWRLKALVVWARSDHNEQVLQSQENQKRADSAVDLKALPAAKRGSTVHQATKPAL